MHSGLQILIFLCLMIVVLGGTHYYLWRRLLAVTDFSQSKKRPTLRYIMLALAVSFPAARLFGSLAGPNTLVEVANWLAVLWMGIALYLLIGTATLHLLAFLLSFVGLRGAVARWLGRRGKFALLGAVIANALVLAGIGLHSASGPAHLTQIEVPLKNLPKSLEGFTIVQLSDLHIGVIIDKERLVRLVEHVNSLQPDLVVITGDLVDEDASYLQELTEPLRKFVTRHGVLAVTGNHDFYAGADDVERHAAAGNVRFLRNDSVRIADSLVVWGLDDPSAKRLQPSRYLSMTQFAEREGQSIHSPSLLLYHQPIELNVAARLGFDLILSGHTHGGQLWPVRYISQMIYPLNQGLVQIGKSFAYISRGTGTWGPPMRVGSPPEIIKFRLHGVQ